MTTENNELGSARAAGPRTGESHRQWLDRIFEEAQGEGIDTDQVWRTMVRLGGDTDDIGNVVERALASRRPDQWRMALLTSVAEAEGLNAEEVTAPVHARPGWTRRDIEDQLERSVVAARRATNETGPASLRRAVEMWIEPTVAEPPAPMQGWADWDADRLATLRQAFETDGWTWSGVVGTRFLSDRYQLDLGDEGVAEAMVPRTTEARDSALRCYEAADTLLKISGKPHLEIGPLSDREVAYARALEAASGEMASVIDVDEPDPGDLVYRARVTHIAGQAGSQHLWSLADDLHATNGVFHPRTSGDAEIMLSAWFDLASDRDAFVAGVRADPIAAQVTGIDVDRLVPGNPAASEELTNQLLTVLMETPTPRTNDEAERLAVQLAAAAQRTISRAGTERPFEQAPTPTRRTSPAVTRQRQAGAGPTVQQAGPGPAIER